MFLWMLSSMSIFDLFPFPIQFSFLVKKDLLSLILWNNGKVYLSVTKLVQLLYNFLCVHINCILLKWSTIIDMIFSWENTKDILLFQND